jgi:hypothetical protein
MDAESYARSLFPYQARCVARMRQMESSEYRATVDTRIGLLTDPPGAGKTRVVVALVTGDEGAAPLVPPPIRTDVVVHALVRFHDPAPPEHEARCTDTTLVVVTQSIVAQWESELVRSSVCRDSMDVVRVEKDVKRIADLVAEGLEAPVAVVQAAPLVQAAQVPLPKVVLVAVRRYRELCAVLVSARVHVRRVVVDEAMIMNDASVGMFPLTAFTWLVSAASPNADAREVIPMRSRAYWNGLALLPHAAFRRIVIRTPDAEIVYPGDVVMRYYVCELDTRLARAAHSVVANHVRALLEANDIQAAIGAMGGTAEEDLMTVVRRRIQQETQLAVLERSRLVLVGAPVQRISVIDQRIARLRRDAESAEERFADALGADCLICQDTLELPILVTCCHALFCGECILTWTHSAMPDARTPRNCPNCRSSEFRIERIAHAATGAVAANGPQAPPAPPAPARVPTKTDAVLRIVREAQQGVMLYSTHLAGLHSAMRALRDAGHTVEEVKGQSRTRDKRLRDFASGSTKVLALDATVNCAGIDLQSLSDIIIYHDMPDPVKEQIIGRGHRVNRAAPLTVHCLWQQ